MAHSNEPTNEAENSSAPAASALPAPARLLCALLLLAAALLSAAFVWSMLRNGPPLGDFFVLWAAARQALASSLAQAYDPAAFNAFKQAWTQGPLAQYPFVYPPPMALLLLPLAGLPHAPAVLCWNLLSLGLFLAGAWRLLRPRRLLLFAAAVAPATTICLVFGQAGLLCGGLVLLGLSCLRPRPVLAGILLGLLALKPQLAALPLALLLFGGERRALLAALATLFALFVASGAVFGFDAWSAWLRGLGGFSGGVAASAAHREYGVTPYFALLALGLPSPAALALQALLAAAVLWLSLRSLRASATPLHLAVPLAGLFLATPYAVAYDLPAAAVAGLALLAQMEREGPQRGELVVLAALWCLPALLVLSAMPLYAVAPLLLAALFALLLRRTLPVR